MNKCPRCESEILKEEYKYCPICGEVLYDEIKDASTEILKALLLNYKNSECEDAEEEEYKMMIVGALSVAISALERTAQEVPVQEQLIKVTLDGSEIAKSLAIHDKV